MGASRSRRRPRKGSTSTRSAPSRAGSTSAAVSLRACASPGKMTRTCVIRRNYLHFIKKYKRFEKRHNNVSVHCAPCFEPKEGDILTIGQCRPLSKTVRFNVVKVEKNQIFGTARKQFRLF